jgi:hypothetical protein
LALRAIRRVQALEDSALRIELTVLVLAPRFDMETTAARLAIARSLATHAATTNARPELVLCPTCNWPPGNSGDQVWSLVELLTAETASCMLPIRIFFPRATS